MKVRISAVIAALKKHVGDGYVYGGTGLICTVALLKARWALYGKPGQSMGPGYYEKNMDFTKGKCAKWLGKWVADCSNLFCAIYRELGGSTGSCSANGFYTRCQSKGLIKTMPKQAGVFVFEWNGKKMSHIGMYIGNGETIEAQGVATGVVRKKFDSRWTHWGKFDTWFTFDVPADGATPPAPPKPPTPPAQKPHGFVKVLASALNVRKGGAVSFPVVKTVHKGEVLEYTDKVGGWYQIKSPAGWVSAEYVAAVGAPTAPAPAKKGTVVANSLNVRSGPGLSYSIIRTIHKGNAVDVLETSGEWVRIAAGAWVSAQYLKL